MVIFYNPILTLIVAGCGGGTKYKDASKDKGSMEWGPREIKTTVNKMVTSLYNYLKAEKKAVYIQVKKIRNRSDEHIDAKMLSDELVTNLMQKRIRFIDRSLTKDALKEIEMGMSGMIDQDSAIPAGELVSPNMYLTGNINSNTRTVRGYRKQYIVVTLKLIELRSGITTWQDRKEFLKVTKNRKTGW